MFDVCFLLINVYPLLDSIYVRVSYCMLSFLIISLKLLLLFQEQTFLLHYCLTFTTSITIIAVSFNLSSLSGGGYRPGGKLPECLDTGTGGTFPHADSEPQPQLQPQHVPAANHKPHQNLTPGYPISCQERGCCY